jgi:hypothetical protein
MNREELLKISSSEIRSNKIYFNLFKQFVEEDLKVPKTECTLCKFVQFHSRWFNYMNAKKNNNMVMEKDIEKNPNNTFILKDPKASYFLNNKILNKDSSDEEMLEYINCSSDSKIKEIILGYFLVLPTEKKGCKRRNRNKRRIS